MTSRYAENQPERRPRYLIAADPADTLYRDYDTTLRIMNEALKLGIEVDYLNLNEIAIDQPTASYLANLPVRKVLTCDPEGPLTEFVTFGPPRVANVAEYDAIMQRKDPPVDDTFRKHAEHFSQAPKHILQINDPASATKFFEKELVQQYPQFSVPTAYCETLAEALHAVRGMEGDAVIKPSNLFSGIGIGFFKHDAPESEIAEHFEKWKPCFVQPYIPEITSIGDLRVLVINQRVIGSVLRVPAPGSKLGNLKQGATPAFFQPTAKQLEAAALISKDLAKYGLHFLGLDFIGDFLTEINMTCPTTVPQAEQVMKEPVGERLMYEIEQLRIQQNAQRDKGIDHA